MPAFSARRRLSPTIRCRLRLDNRGNRDPMRSVQPCIDFAKLARQVRGRRIQRCPASLRLPMNAHLARAYPRLCFGPTIVCGWLFHDSSWWRATRAVVDAGGRDTGTFNRRRPRPRAGPERETNGDRVRFTNEASDRYYNQITVAVTTSFLRIRRSGTIRLFYPALTGMRLAEFGGLCQ